MSKQIQVGDVVRMTGKFLRSTGQLAGGDGHRRWRVLGIHGSFVEVNEPSCTEFTTEELAEDPSLANRRIHLGNLEKVM